MFLEAAQACALRERGVVSGGLLSAGEELAAPRRDHRAALARATGEGEGNGEGGGNEIPVAEAVVDVR
jgi:hypothetical protein